MKIQSEQVLSAGSATEFFYINQGSTFYINQTSFSPGLPPASLFLSAVLG